MRTFKDSECDKSNSRKSEGSKNRAMETNGNKAWEVFWKVVSVTFIPWMAFVTLMLFSIDKRVAIIENNRFDSRDGMEMMKMIDKKANKSEVPPQWLIDRIERLEDERE